MELKDKIKLLKTKYRPLQYIAPGNSILLRNIIADLDWLDMEEPTNANTHLHEKETQETTQQEPPNGEDNAPTKQHSTPRTPRKASMGLYRCITEETRYKPRRTPNNE